MRGLWREFTHGWAATRLLVALRWRMVRGRRARAAMVVGFLVMFFALFVASQVGALIRTLAEEGVGTAAGQFAVNYVISLNRGELGTVGAGAIGTAVLVALFSPFSGSATQPLAPTDAVATLRPPRTHRYFDAVLTQTVSAIGFFQLVILTGLGALLTLDGGRLGGLVFMWSLWPLLMCLSVAAGWGIELVHRTLGRAAKVTLGAVTVLAVALVVWLDPNDGRTLFGGADAAIATLRAAAAGEWSGLAVGVTSAWVLTALLVAGGWWLCRLALAHPAPVPARAHASWGARLRVPSAPVAALVRVVAVGLLRTGQVRRPLVTIVAIGVPAVWLGSLETTATTLVIAIPLAVALAFGVNFFGVLGTAMPWLMSQPFLARHLVLVLHGLQVGVMAAMAAVIWGPYMLFSTTMTTDLAIDIATGTVVAVLFTARSATAKSIRQPLPVRLAARGEVIVPPLRSLNYTMRFALWSGQLGVVAMTLPATWQPVAVAFALAWTALRLVGLQRAWADPATRAQVVRAVAT